MDELINNIAWPTTPEGWHEHWLKLDDKFGTAPDSPLHHDNRCDYCRDEE